MSNAAILAYAPRRGDTRTTPWGFICAALGMARSGGALGGLGAVALLHRHRLSVRWPAQLARISLFPHAPAVRWGRLRGFFLLAFAGILGLTVGFAALWWFAEHGLLSDEIWEYGFAGLNTLLLLWIATLVQVRSQQNPRREWGWIWPVAFALIAVAWLVPPQWGLVLVYVHPLMAFWLFDRELRRSRAQWRPAFHLCLACLPLLLFALWWRLVELRRRCPATTT